MKVEGCDDEPGADRKQPGNLVAMVRELGLAVPCRNRRAGCGERAAEEGGAMEEHEDECEYRNVSLLLIITINQGL